MKRICLLGPQRLSPDLDRAVAAHGVHGRIAAVTAGWEEREHEDQELGAHLGGRTVNLHLYSRGEDVFHHDRELFEGMQERHDRLRALQDVYRGRLRHALAAARELLRNDGDAALLDPEREDAILAVRRLDEMHLRRVVEVQAEFDARFRPQEREHIARHRGELAHILADCEALCVAGGHVAILLNRLRMFDVVPTFDGPIFAWSAGAMAIAEQVVLFHDSPPQGAGNAEVLGPGLGLLQGVVPLPHARRRLRLDDATRVGLFARRFGPALCVALEENSRVDWQERVLAAEPGTRRLTEDGQVLEVEAA